MKINAINSTINQSLTQQKLQNKVPQQRLENLNCSQENLSFKANWKNLLKPSNIIGAICTAGLAIPFIVAENKNSEDSGDGVFDTDNFDTYYHTHLP